MKKLISLALAFFLALTLAVPAFAADAGMDNFQKVKTYTGFSDVASNHWAASAIQTCYEYDLMRGNSDTTFNLTGDLTIAEALVMAAKVHEIYATGTSTVAPGGTPWYQPFVDYCVNAQIIGADEFADYGAKATRAQMAGIFARALPSSEFTSTSPYSPPDVTGSTPYYSEILKLYASGILSGSDIYGTFKPNDSISRGEAAVIISRVAIAESRSVKVLMKDVTLADGVVAAVPQDILDMSDYAGMPALGSETSIILTYGEKDDLYAGLDISLMPQDEFNALMKDSFGFEMTDVQTSLVKFGNLTAYRTTSHTVLEGMDLDMVTYTYIHDSTMTMVFLGSSVSDDLTVMANNLRINGSGVGSKM